MAATTTIDVKGLNCPLPLLRAKKALAQLTAGDVLTVVATDPGSTIDFLAFCDQAGHDMLSHGKADGIFTFVIRKGG